MYYTNRLYGSGRLVERYQRSVHEYLTSVHGTGQQRLLALGCSVPTILLEIFVVVWLKNVMDNVQ